jgi:hypothetical protein
MSNAYPSFPDTTPFDPLHESECNAPPHVDTPFDPIVALDKEDEHHGMQMLVWLGLCAVTVWTVFAVSILRQSS